LRPALRQSHLDNDRIRPPRQQGIRQIGLPRVTVKVTHNENEALAVGASQKLAEVERPVVHLDRRDPDSAPGQRLGHSP
jgi:hypothetical protein